MNRKYTKFGHWHFGGRELLSILDKVRATLNQKEQKTSSLNYDFKTVNTRVCQILLYLNLTEFMDIFGRKSLSQGKNYKHSTKEMINFSRFSVCISGDIARVSIQLKFFIRNIIKFFYFILRSNYWFLIGSISSSRKKNSTISLLVEMSIKDLLKQGSFEKFKDFANSGPISELHDSDYLIVQSEHLVQTTFEGRYIFAPNYYKELIFFLNLSDFPSFFRLTTSSFFSYFKLCFENPVYSLLAEDYAHNPIFEILDKRRQIKSYNMTCSLLSSQPLFSRRKPGQNYYSNMIWYSSGINQFAYKSDFVKTADTFYYFLECTKAYVWYEEQKTALEEFCFGHFEKIAVVGPILWSLLPEIHLSEKSVKKLTIFDLTPVNEEINKKEIRGKFCYRYGNEENCIKFLKDAFGVMKELSPKSYEIVIKPKKNLSSSMISSKYKQFLEEYRTQLPIKVLNVDEDIIELIDSSSVVMVMPFSSPAHAATNRSIPSFFYDPTGLLSVDGTYQIEGCSFIQGKFELREYLSEIFKEGKN